MRKGIIRASAISLLVVMSLTGCGTSTNKEAIVQENNQEVVALKVWGAQEDHALLSGLIEGFKAQYSEEATFDITLEAVNETDCKYELLGNVNEAADVFTFADDQIMTFAAAGILEPVPNQEEIKARNLEGAVEAANLNGLLYGYPLTADNGYFMYYNKAYFSEEDVKSLDRMLEIAAQNDKKIAMDWSSGWYLYSFFGNTGLTLGLNEDYVSNYCTWNATNGEIKGTDVLEAMRNIASSKGFTNIGDDAFTSGVADGSVIAGINGVWNAIEVEEVWQENYGAVKLPTYKVAGKDVQMASYAGYKMIGVNAYSDHVEWADKLADYLSNEQSQAERFKQRGQGPSNIQAANSKEIIESVAMSALIAQSAYANAQRVGELYWDAATELGMTLASGGDLKGLSDQEFMNKIVNQITSSIVKE